MKQRGIGRSISAVLMMHWMIALFFSHQDQIPNKSRRKYEANVVKFGEKIRELHDKIGISKTYSQRFIKELVAQFIGVIEFGNRDVCTYLEVVINTVWEMKKREMNCMWYKCDNQAKDLVKLYKCKRCRVARYCSKSCQKRDWKNGNHKELCDKFVAIQKPEYMGKLRFQRKPKKY